MTKCQHLILLLVTMRWNGTDITRVPTFIFHDELIAGNATLPPDPDGPGVLSCSSASGTTTINWNFVDRIIIPAGTGSIILKNNGTIKSQVLQNESRPLPTGGRPEAFLNGLWSCTQGGTRLHVGLYFRPSRELDKINS